MIRPLREHDLDTYVALRLRSLRECPLAFSASAEDDAAASRESLLSSLQRAPAWMLFGAFEGSTLAGAAGLMRARHAKAAHRMHLWGMYVAPEHRRRGFGAQLLEAAIAHARVLAGVAWIDLSVTSAAVAARDIYTRAGFTTWGTTTDALRYDGRAADEHHMTLRLG